MAKSHGEEHWHAKLTETQVKHIRTCAESTYELARRYGCSASHVGQVRRGIYWKHLAEKSSYNN